jgi:hypothetical protein
MNRPFNTYLWYIAEIEENIREDGETEEEGGGAEEEEGVEVGFLGRFGGCDVVRGCD